MGQLSHRVDVPFPLFDADNHLYEPPEALTKFLPKEYKDYVQYVQINGRTKIALRGVISNYIPNPTFEVVARPGAWEEYFKYGNPDGKSKRELFGEPMRAIPAFFEPGPRLEKMNELGLDRTLMFPTLASLIEERLRDDPVAIHVLIHALNQWLDEVWGFNYQNRIFTTPVITLPIVEKAIEELEWVVKRGARCILIRPRSPASAALGRSRCPSSIPSGSGSSSTTCWSVCTPATVATRATPPSGTAPTRRCCRSRPTRWASSTSGGRSRTPWGRG
jgi:hypothetical protein